MGLYQSKIEADWGLKLRNHAVWSRVPVSHHSRKEMVIVAENGSSDWQQIRVNVPADFYDVLKIRSGQHGTSLSAEALRLMRLGLAGVKPGENISADITALKRYLELHLEPLMFVAAMDSAKVAAYEKQRIIGQRQAYLRSNPRPDGQDDSQAQARLIDREMSMQATRRIQRVLHEIEAPMAPMMDLEEGEGDNADED